MRPGQSCGQGQGPLLHAPGKEANKGQRDVAPETHPGFLADAGDGAFEG